MRPDDTGLLPDPSPASPLPGPEHYPWIDRAPRVAVLRGDGEVVAPPVPGLAQLDHLLAAEGAAPLAERTLVVAVGSNQAPAVIARKYARAARQVRPATPFVPCTVAGLAVGHSAHASRGGYVAAAPYRRPGARTELVASWFDAEQLAVLDETEPNYHRLEVDAAQHPVHLVTGQQPACYSLYASRWGVLGNQHRYGHRPWTFRHQAELFAQVHQLTGTPLLAGDAAAVCTRLAQDPSAFTQVVRQHRLAVQDGLVADAGL